MTWAAFYLICLGVGVVMSALSLISGAGHVDLHAHLPFHMHLPHFGHGGSAHGMHVAHGAPDGGLARLASFNFSAMMAFLACFGGAGYLLTRHGSIGAVLTALLALVGGVCGATIVNAFLVKVLLENERELAPATMVGTLGTVTVPIRVGGTGEIVYLHEDSRCSAGARSDDGVEIGNGSEVVVTRFEEGIAYVRRAELSDRDEVVAHVHAAVARKSAITE